MKHEWPNRDITMPPLATQPPSGVPTKGAVGRWQRAWRRVRRATWASMAAVALVACGGGELLLFAIPGVGTGGTGIVLGTLTGLGSVIVDGVRYDDSQATLESQPDLATPQPLTSTDLAVGQQVGVEFDATGAATKVQVWAQVAGPVQAIDGASGRLVVWGQAVEIVSEAATGNATLVSGYARWQDIQPQDLVQVYGTRGVDARDGVGVVLQATRIEKIPALPGGLARATGVLQRDAAQRWVLGGLVLNLSGAHLLPQGATLQPGDWVTATGAQAVDNAVDVPWGVSRLRVWRTSQPEGRTLHMQGVWRAGAGRLITAPGWEVDVSAPGVQNQLRALPDGARVQVQGHIQPSTGILVASEVQVAPLERPGAELRGSITSWVNSASFVVRGMRVDGSTATWVGESVLEPVGNGRYVEIKGTVQGGVVRATEVTLKPAPERAVLDLTGIVVAADASTGRFSLQSGGNTVSVAAPSGPLPGLGETVQVQGRWQEGGLRAEQVVAREPTEATALELEGVVDAVTPGYFLLNGQRIGLDEAVGRPLLMAWVRQLAPGQRVHVRVQAVAGRYLLVAVLPKNKR